MKKIFLVLFSVFLLAAGCAAKQQMQQNIIPPGEKGMVGATVPTVVSRYETSLSAKLTSTATSTMTLTSDPLYTAIGTYLTGTACFTIDEGTASVEDVCGTASGTTISSLTRGISPLTGTSTVAALQFEHRKGATVKITDGPQLIVISRILNGNETFPHLISLDSSISTSSFSTYNFVTKQYVDGGLLQGAPTATTTTPGVVQIATTAQIAAGTGMTGQYTLVPAGSLFSQAWRSATTVPVTSATGTLASSFIDQTVAYTWTGNHTFNATTTILATTTKPIILDGVSYVFTNTQGAANSFLTNDGSGNLSWATSAKLFSTTTANSFFSSSTPTVFATTVPANTLAPGRALRGRFYATWRTVSTNAKQVFIYFGGSNCAQSLSKAPGATTDVTFKGYLTFTIVEGNSTTAQSCDISFSGPDDQFNVGGATNLASLSGNGTAAVDITSSQALVIQVSQGNSATEGFTINQGTIDVIK